MRRFIPPILRADNNLGVSRLIYKACSQIRTSVQIRARLYQKYNTTFSGHCIMLKSVIILRCERAGVPAQFRRRALSLGITPRRPASQLILWLRTKENLRRLCSIRAQLRWRRAHCLRVPARPQCGAPYNMWSPT